jgi:hypothetical protein
LAGSRSITAAISGRAVVSLVLVTTREEQPPASTPSGGGISRSPIAHRRPEFTITRPPRSVPLAPAPITAGAAFSAALSVEAPALPSGDELEREFAQLLADALVLCEV